MVPLKSFLLPNKNMEKLQGNAQKQNVAVAE